MSEVFTTAAPPFSETAVLRYARCEKTDEIDIFIRELTKETREKLKYQVCYQILPLSVHEDMVDVGQFSVRASDLAANLAGCERVVLFAATIGTEIDRLIRKYSHIDLMRALLLQALATERIEALCDAFCEHLKTKGFSLCPRFSPGYGSVPLTLQRDIFRVLTPEKSIGLYLSDTCMMTPSKSVTAFVGVTRKETT